MKSNEVLRLLDISRITLMTYVKKGLIKVTLLPNGFYDYDDESVNAFLGTKKRFNVIYTRVSTDKQKDNLAKQIQTIQQHCADNKIDIQQVYSEISSGIDLDRTQFGLLLNDIFKYKIDKVYITNKDRLTKLSFQTIESMFKQFGTSIVVLSKSDKCDHNEIFDELSSLMQYFSAKQYSNKRIKAITNN